MQKVNMYGLTQFLMKSAENGHSIKLGTISGETFGVVTHLDTQGPFPSVFLKHPKADNGVGVALHHIVTFCMAGAEHQPNTIPNEDGEQVTVL